MTMNRRLLLAGFLMLGCLTVQLVLQRQVVLARSASIVELNQPLDAFPSRLGLWTGVDRAPDPQIIKDIKIDGYLQRTYSHPSGETLILWVSYSKKSTDQYHYPTVCMAGNGWKEDEATRTNVTLGAPETEMKRMLFHRRQEPEFVYYWYYLIGEDAVDRLMREWSKTARAFLRGRRNASMTVEVFSQAPAPNVKLLDEFAGLAAAELWKFVPAGADSACDLGANY